MTVLIYMSFDLSLRREKLAEIIWCNEETARNIYLYYDLMTIITNYHKSQWRIKTWLTARFLSSAVEDLLVRYLIYVLFFLRFLVNCTQQLILENTLFSKTNSTWTVDQVSFCVKHQISLVLSQRITTRQ